jgi:uncharacterized protein (DUF885 family)
MAHDAPARSALFEFADRLVQEHAALDPIIATHFGIKGYDDQLPEYSDDRWARDAAFSRSSLEAVRAITPTDDVDRIAKAVMEERLGSRGELEASGELARTFGVINSPISEIRQVFELMATETHEDLANVRARLSAVRHALDTWRAGLESVAARGELPPRRHLVGIAEQAALYASGGYARFAEPLAAGSDDPDALRAAAGDADAACGEFAQFLTERLAPEATEVESCGSERYVRWARYFTGADLDVDELYAWGWEDLSRINERMWELAGVLHPGAKRLAEVADALDARDDGAVVGTAALVERLEAFTAATIESLDGVHFDIDPRIRRCDARIAPEGSAAAPYYIAPSEDLTRPGTTWYPTLGRTRFPWWRIASTWYHEGVPGHHLEGAGSLLLADRLSRFQRLEGWISGDGEGWALYAERLMEELGGFADPADELGYLEGQSLRAARIVVDLGLHLGFPAPKDLGTLGDLGDCSSKPWTPEMAVALLEERAITDPEMASSEVDRYLSMPGQAISYKVGERVWLGARADARARLGDRFDLKRFHAHALGLGPMGLGPFRVEVDRWDGS